MPRPRLVARPAERAGLAAALAAEDLPHADLDEDGRQFFAFDDETGHRIGYGGFERYGTDALLRSIVVLPACRGKGYGASLLALLLERARRSGATTFYLLTLTAAEFFEAHGFVPCPRAAVPRAIADTREFRSLCPQNAACLKMDFSRTSSRARAKPALSGR